MEAELSWISDPEEVARIAAVREALGVQLQDLPADLCDDVTIARFLRGNNDDPAEAGEKLAEAVRYRKEVIMEPDIARMREAVQNQAHDTFDLKLWETVADVHAVLPIFRIEGLTVGSELPIMGVVPGNMDFDKVFEVFESGRFKAFAKLHFEHRWLHIHKLSHKQRRMVKFTDVRDLNTSAYTLIAKVPRFVEALKQDVSSIMEHYPEMVHNMVIMGAPPTFSMIFGLISSLLNERMRAKFRIFARGAPFEEVARLMDARALWSLTSQVYPEEISSMVVEAGRTVCAVRWLEQGETATWKFSLEYRDIVFKHCFLPQAAKGVTPEPVCNEQTVPSDSVQEGSYTAESPGVLWLCADNTSSMWTSKTVTLTMTP